MKKAKITLGLALVALAVTIGAFLGQPTTKSELEQKTAEVEKTEAPTEQVSHVTGTTNIVISNVEEK